MGPKNWLGIIIPSSSIDQSPGGLWPGLFPCANSCANFKENSEYFIRQSEIYSLFISLKSLATLRKNPEVLKHKGLRGWSEWRDLNPCEILYIRCATSALILCVKIRVQFFGKEIVHRISDFFRFGFHRMLVDCFKHIS